MNFLKNFDRDGFVISDKVFNETALTMLDDMASELPPDIGHSKTRGWLDGPDILNIKEEIDWACHWSTTPTNEYYINEVILPTISEVCDELLGKNSWGWQLTNRYIISNYNNNYPYCPHIDAPYVWPQAPNIQMAKYLNKGTLSITFMIPLIEFTVENGATGFIPGSHKQFYDTSEWKERIEQRRAFFTDNFIQPHVPLGSFTCFHGNLMHSVMPNLSNVVRRGIIFRGIRNDALQEMDRLGLG